MIGLPVAVCPPQQESWYGSDPYRPTRKDRVSETPPFLAKIDQAIEWVVSLPTKLKSRKPPRRQIVLSDRMNLAQSGNLTKEEMELLLVDPNPLVRMELAWNNSVTEAILIRLLKDRNSSVSNIAKVRLKTLLELTV